MKMNNIEFDHGKINVQLRFHDGFAPTWEAYVRWPGYKNRKYFTTVSAWKHLPSEAREIVKTRINKKLGVA